MVTTVYLLRHAEKGPDPGNGDPSLSAAGAARAEALASELASVSIAAVYASEYLRTQETVTPVADDNGLSVTIVGASQTATLAQRLRQDHVGGASVACGHSNTVPAVASALGVQETIVLQESDYGDLFVITIDDLGNVSVDRDRYGD